MKSMGVIQGYEIVAVFFKLCQNTENQLKLVEIDNSLRM